MLQIFSFSLKSSDSRKSRRITTASTRTCLTTPAAVSRARRNSGSEECKSGMRRRRTRRSGETCGIKARGDIFCQPELFATHAWRTPAVADPRRVSGEATPNRPPTGRRVWRAAFLDRESRHGPSAEAAR
ncbi:hypothetical protein PVAP13_9NG157873 [Panicum virgatum]|uniref:Uncharacterized protein n=1 Tax=Panicum virgatum TaxID=38727 RepID=A0A8T0MG79_PANVG|nr:hypothetical protein PVAP13_9NG157873 [Panicum virgatum]